MRARSSSPTRKHSAHFAGLATGHQHRTLGIILNHVDAYVFMKDAEGRYIFYANSKVCEVMQYPLEEILGHTDAELLSAEAAADIMAFDQQALVSPFPLRRARSLATRQPG